MSFIVTTEKVNKSFGGIKALKDINITLPRKQITALIGPNGAGKTTLFNCLTGIYKPTNGKIIFHQENGKNVEIQGKKPNQVAEQGIGRTFQNIRLFSGMSALENIMVGCHIRSSCNFVSAIFNTRSFKREEKAILEKSYRLLKLIGLEEQGNALAGSLPYAFQRKLEIARALAINPSLLLLDEPAAGMNDQETLGLNELILAIQEQFPITILLIEHDMKLVMQISESIIVMNQGALIATGTPHEIQNNELVISAYLGT